MISYTITAPLVDGTTYGSSSSNSGNTQVTDLGRDNGYGFTEIPMGINDMHYTNSGGNGSGSNSYKINADGGQSGRGIGGITETQNYNQDQILINAGRTITYVASGTTSPAGFYTTTENNQLNFYGYYSEPGFTDSDSQVRPTTNSGSGHVLVGTIAPVDSNGNTLENAQAFIRSGQPYYFWTYASQTTTQTTVTNYNKITTTTREKLAKVGTTITQGAGTSVVTLPTTTNAKSWTENTTTNTTATEDATVLTTSMGIDSYWKKTAHTVYILKNGETTAFLKSDVALNATNGGPTDTKAYDTFSGPTTFTITRAAGTTSEKIVLDGSVTDVGFYGGEWAMTTVTIRQIVAANSTGTYFYPGSPHHLPLSSGSITIQTGVSESSFEIPEDKRGTGSWGANAPTTTRSAWGQSTVTYSLAGVSWTGGVQTFTVETYAQPIVRSGAGSFSNDLAVGKEYYEEEIDGEWVETFSTFPIEGITGTEGGSNAGGESGNYFVYYKNEFRGEGWDGGPFFDYAPAGADAFYGLTHAWGTLGGTTAEPHQSISVPGISSSESVTWPFVSISAGVATPKPFVTVSQKPPTSATSSTAATKTEITTRRIWGDEFGKTTSSQNSSTAASGSTITPIQAGGDALTSFQFRRQPRGFPVNRLAGGWIPNPDVLVIGGIARTSSSTAIIPPGEYVNSSFTELKSFSGSSIANSYFERKGSRTYLCSPSP